MSGAIPPILINAFIAWKEKISALPFVTVSKKRPSEMRNLGIRFIPVDLKEIF
jgi:hypothetical protein